jgi:ComF family protein
MSLDFTHWKTRLLDILFPPLCAACHTGLLTENNQGLCDVCFDSFKLPESFTCPECRGRIPFSKKGLPLVAELCHPKAGYLLLACSFYEHPVTKNLIGQLKFERRTSIAAILGKIATRALTASKIPTDFLSTPIPLSTARLRERGFNQAELITDAIIKSFPDAHSAALLTRTKNTETQSRLTSWDLRKKNLQGAFSAQSDQELHNRTILIVDDVWTSGATMGDAVRALREKGVGRIVGLVIGRIR